MHDAALTLFTTALNDAALLSIPVVAAVAVVGVAVGMVQTIAQIQDQNVAFAPKLCVLALIVASGGPTALNVLRELLLMTIAALPRISSQ